MNEEINQLKEENDRLKCRNVCLALDLENIKRENLDLKQELTDTNCILTYVESQANEMRYMIKHQFDFENQGTLKDQTSRRPDKFIYSLQPETIALLEPYVKPVVG